MTALTLLADEQFHTDVDCFNTHCCRVQMPRFELAHPTLLALDVPVTVFSSDEGVECLSSRLFAEQSNLCYEVIVGDITEDDEHLEFT